MARCPELPFLPGFTFNPLLGKTKFNKDVYFDYLGPGNPGLVEKVKPNILGPLTDRYPSVYPRGEVPEIPAWIGYDKQILRFDAFFQETLQEYKGAPFLIRKVKILFFLEDGTIQVSEPKVDNSGIFPCNVIGRQRIRFPPPMDFNFYDILDLNVGYEVDFYSRVYKIVDCDKFTRNFLNRCGIAVPDPINFPQDPYLVDRALAKETCMPKRPAVKDRSFAQFLKNDGKVLRFYGYWDDQDTPFGYLHNLEIHYYLADDTIDIKENTIDNAGRTSSFIFMKRAKLPKVYKGLPGPGAHSKSTVLNVLSSGPGGRRYMSDCLNCGTENVEYYGEQDLTIGGVINVYGRKVVLTNCDSYTKELYRVKYGICDFTPVATPVDRQEGIEPPLKRILPPWNGYGTFEDSAQNCITVAPKAPQRDFKKFLKLDRIGIDSHILRYEAKLISKIPENCGRTFIISYYLCDDTLAVYELAKRNSGFQTKPFFKRCEVQLPGQPTFTSTAPECYKAQHLFVGATIVVNGFEFVLIEADEYALRYMEINSHEYPKSNIKLIVDKVREKLRPIYKDFVAENLPKESRVISYYQLRNKLCQIMGRDFTEQEMITISRAFSATCVEEKFTREAVRALALTELKKLLWDDLERLTEYFHQFDINKLGFMPKDQVQFLLKSSRLPLDRNLLNKILNVIRVDCNGNLDYNDLLSFLDRKNCPLADTLPINIKYELSTSAEREPKPGTLIDWCAFNKELDLEQTLIDASNPYHN